MCFVHGSYFKIHAIRTYFMFTVESCDQWLKMLFLNLCHKAFQAKLWYFIHALNYHFANLFLSKFWYITEGYISICDSICKKPGTIPQTNIMDDKLLIVNVTLYIVTWQRGVWLMYMHDLKGAQHLRESVDISIKPWARLCYNIYVTLSIVVCCIARS